MPDIQLYSAAEVREFDRRTIEDIGIAGLTLMKRAASACVDVIMAHHDRKSRVLVACGSGNNAGDGFIVAGMLAEKQYPVTVSVVGDVEKLGPDASAAYTYCRSTDAVFADDWPEADVIVDALLGTGLRGDVRSEYARIIDRINDDRSKQDAAVLSVDIPSGLCADTGRVLGVAVKADATVTFIGRKRGLYTLAGPDLVGDLHFAGLGVPQEVFDDVPGIKLLDKPTFAARQKHSFKNSHGHLLIVGGHTGMAGAVLMAAQAALRTGAGLVSVASCHDAVRAINVRQPEAMAREISTPADLDSLLARASAIVLGPGLGTDDWSRMMFDAVIEANLPMVVDADGLNLLAGQPRHRDDWILTPHPGEARRLLGHDPQEDRFQSVMTLAKQFGGVALIKGAGTVIAGPGGVQSLCPFGNPGMATAGMGDVLSGVLGGLLAQGYTTLDATMRGVAIHAIAGDRAAIAGERGMVATDVMPFLRELVNET